MTSDALLRLHGYLESAHWRGDALLGPDVGVRFNYRAGRFVKSALRTFPWGDVRYYLQGQAYWVIANWRLADEGGAHFAEIATRCSDEMVRRQRPDGAWDYPNPAWKGRIATAEGTWAALGLLETYAHTRDAKHLDGARRWLDYLQNEISWRTIGEGLAVNYFANRDGPPVPNNTAFVLRLLGELALATGDHAVLADTNRMAIFLAEAQRPSGELPYAVGPVPRRLEHFQCLQYNAFQLLDLLRYDTCTGDGSLRPTATGIARFLAASIDNEGQQPHDCLHLRPTVVYHGAATAAALAAAHDAGLSADGAELARRVWAQVAALQRDDGSFPHSLGDHRILSDQRSYPRNLAMILTHGLLVDRQPATDTGVPQEPGR
ncbi:MAG: hypothetical protein JWN29_1794 [Acidimicrobiales bacterium]|nr:hypothetical protein [Acidimicrobiales bacterium]